jgi:hypothetical protein
MLHSCVFIWHSCTCTVLWEFISLSWFKLIVHRCTFVWYNHLLQAPMDCVTNSSSFSCPSFSLGYVGAPVLSIIERCYAKRIWFHLNNLLKKTIEVFVKSHLEPQYCVALFSVMVCCHLSHAILTPMRWALCVCVCVCVCACVRVCINIVELNFCQNWSHCIFWLFKCPFVSPCAFPSCFLLPAFSDDSAKVDLHSMLY